MSETNYNWLTFSEEFGEETIELIKCIFENKEQNRANLFIDANTGKGKSYFLKNMLYNFCKENKLKMLYLLPRRIVRDEFITELTAENKTDVITVKAYQEFEQRDDYSSYEEYLRFEENNGTHHKL